MNTPLPKFVVAKFPCCRSALVKVHPEKQKQDKLCPTCKHWWRVDTRTLKRNGKALFTNVEWTHIGPVENVIKE